MDLTDFGKTTTARARARAQMFSAPGRRTAVRDHAAAVLERRVETARRAARGAGPARSRVGSQVPKT